MISVYFDASVLVALFVKDHFTAQAEALLTAKSQVLVSDLAAAEVASVLARLTREKQLTIEVARSTGADFDFWLARSATRTETLSIDIRLAEQFIRRLEFNIRAPDAIHLATATRLGIPLATFDTGLAANARRVGLNVFEA